MAFREYHYRWEFDLKSTPEQLWPFVADTNRFNRDTGLPKLELDHGGKLLRNARKKVKLSIHGMAVEWEEQPFEWVKPKRFGLERTYTRGPMARMRALMELTPLENGGTRMNYEVWATPRNVRGAVAIPLEITLRSARKFKEAFRRYDEIAYSGSQVTTSQINSSSVAYEAGRLAALKEKLLADVSSSDMPEQANVLVEQLVDFIQHGDDFSVARIRPYQLADEWQEPRRVALETCLRATRIGLLDFQWDLLCPLCRGAKQSESSLKDIETSVHCSTCNITFTANFDRYVELTFKPNAAIRRVEAADFCIGSPQRTPHVVAQQLLPAHEQRSLELPLEQGNYRLRALELEGSQLISVSADGQESVPVVLTDQGLNEVPFHVAERSIFELRNETDHEQLVILERQAWSDQATTAAEVTALQMFRDLFSSEALRPGQQISVGTLTVLFTDLRNSTRLYRDIGDATAFGRVMNHFDVLKSAIVANDGAIVKTIGDAVMAVFQSPAAALSAMLDAQETLAAPPDGGMPLTLKAGLHTGPCIAVTLNDRLDYFGSTVNMASRLEALSTGSDVIISQRAYEDSKVQELLGAEGLGVESFHMALKGFEEETIELWRVRKN